MPWLVKTEPATYSFDDLLREQRTAWTGVANPTAMKHLVAMKKGDRVVVYHTGKERRAVGLATVQVEGAEPELAASTRLMRPVSLDTLKASTLFHDSPLVRIGRLAVVPLDEAQYAFILAQSGG